jgi:hypothetical protein
MAKTHTFILSKDSILGLLQGSIKEIEYCYNKKVHIGECVVLKEYSNGANEKPPMYIDAYITSVREVPKSSKQIHSYIFGLNIQLIMF